MSKTRLAIFYALLPLVILIYAVIATIFAIVWFSAYFIDCIQRGIQRGNS